MSASRFRDLSEQHVAYRGGTLRFLFQPLDHLLECQSHGIFQRLGATQCADVCRCLDPWMIQSGRSFLERYFYGERCCDLDRPHAIAFPVALDRVTVAEKQVSAVLIDSQHDSVARGDLLNVKIAAMRAIIYGQN